MNVWVIVGIVIHLLLIVRVLTRPDRRPISRIAWIVVVIAFPILGVLAYIFFGEVNIGRSRVSKLHKIIEGMPDFPAAVPGDEPHLYPDIPEQYTSLFAVGKSINGFDPVGGNRAELPADSNAVIDRMVADIDAAKET